MSQKREGKNMKQEYKICRKHSEPVPYVKNCCDCVAKEYAQEKQKEWQIAFALSQRQDK